MKKTLTEHTVDRKHGAIQRGLAILKEPSGSSDKSAPSVCSKQEAVRVISARWCQTTPRFISRCVTNRTESNTKF